MSTAGCGDCWGIAVDPEPSWLIGKGLTPRATLSFTAQENELVALSVETEKICL